MIELPGVQESGMPRRDGQRKPGTTRGSPRRSRTAKALRISRFAVQSRCARGWGGWGRLSDDGSRQHNSGKSEDPWGGGLPHLQGGARSNGRPDTARDYRNVTRCAKGGHKLHISHCMPGAGLSWLVCGKVPPYMPAFQPYRGKPAVRNDREGRGNVGIIRSPDRASTLPDGGGARGNSRPYREMTGLWPVLCRFSDAGNDDLTARSGDRRPKSAKARNRVGRWCGGCAAGAMAIWPPGKRGDLRRLSGSIEGTT